MLVGVVKTPNQRVQEEMDRCRHFNGVQNDICEAGINFRALVGEPFYGWVKRLPCLKEYGSGINCGVSSFPSRTDAEAALKKRDEATVAFLKKVFEDRICPGCDQPYEGKQVGRCVYCERCGYRLYQGTAP